MRNFPFLSSSQSLLLFRIVLPLFFVTHAVVRIANGTIECFAVFLSNRGLYCNNCKGVLLYIRLIAKMIGGLGNIVVL